MQSASWPSNAALVFRRMPFEVHGDSDVAIALTFAAVPGGPFEVPHEDERGHGRRRAGREIRLYWNRR
jgi:hypothetical protein